MSNTAATYGAYKKVDIETASQGKLIVMLFNGAIQRAEEAKRQMVRGRLEGIHNNLIRAQEIIAELRGALDMKAGEIARNLDRIYEYLQHLLIKANVRKEVAPIEDCIALMIEMRDTWTDAFARVDKDSAIHSSQVNPHGNSVMNIQG